MKKMFSSLLDRLFVVLGALIFLQIPLFMSQYQHQLTGHVDELRWQVEHMETAAKKADYSLERYIKKFQDHSDKAIASQATMMEKIVSRWNRLSNGLFALTHSSLITRPFFFLYYFQWDIAKSTFHSFTPGIPFNIEGLCYALFGMGAGFLLFHMLCRAKQNKMAH